MRAKQVILLLLCGTLAACAQQPGKPDPLQNTRKLAVEGHTTLYDNGAFEIPMTTIHIIPPGPGAVELAAEFAGLRARQSFQEAIKHARESVGLAHAGIEKSSQAAKAIERGTDAVAGGARGVTRYGGRMLGSSPGMVSDIVAASVTYSGEVYTETSQAGAKLAEDSVAAGGEISTGATEASGKIWAGTMSLAGSTATASKAAAGKHASFAAERFIEGYAAVPENLGQRVDAVKKSASLAQFADAYQRSNAWRSEQSGGMSDIVVKTAGGYTNDIGESFSAAGREFQDDKSTFGMLKSMRWVLQGIFWDAAIKPAGKVTAASLGYVTVNAVAFPVMVITREGVTVADVAVQVTWNGAASVYDVTAPTGTAAVAGLFSAVELVGGQALAGSELAAGSLATAGTYGVGKGTAGVVAGGGYLTGKTVQYVGAPLSTLGIAGGGTTIGVVAGAGTAVGGVGVATAGIAGEGVTRLAGNAAADTVLVGGSATSVVAGTALGTYELSKAVVVPTGYAVGSGLVLGYATLSQLSAQTILAVADASYMVLSLEGPNWVLYAVKGKVDNGENIPPGALIALKPLQQAGETIIAVPVSDGEIKRLVNAVPEQISVKAAPKTAQP